jgi:hypothetical protein
LAIAHYNATRRIHGDVSRIAGEDALSGDLSAVREEYVSGLHSYVAAAAKVSTVGSDSGL